MYLRHPWLGAGIGFCILMSAFPALAQTAALTGQVSSAEERVMEGVLVSARKDGSPITVTVVSNEKGRYSFPEDRLAPGRYALSIRAIGYELDAPRSVEVRGGTAAGADLKLARVRNVVPQLSNGEWLASLPGADRQKAFLTQCVGCHTLERVLTAKHDATGYQEVFKRMSRYSPGSMPSHPQPLLPGPRGERPAVTGDAAIAAAEYLASVTLGANGSGIKYAFKTLPRPKGQATRVIITEYDLPRKEAMVHDVIVDSDGKAWYSDFGHQFVGVLDPATGQVKDIAIPVLKPEQPKGGLDVEFDPDGNVWLSMMFQAGIARIDRKTHQVTTYGFPKEWQSPSTQASMVSPMHMNVDGKVWTNNQEDHYAYRLHVASGKWENLGQAKDPGGKQIRAYGMPTDLQNNVYQLEFGGAAIGLRNAKSGEVKIWPTQTERSRPRRGRVDEQNRLWFAQYGGNRVAMFDPKTEGITEWMLQTPWSAPYDVAPTRGGGEVWTGSMLTDQVSRVDTKSGLVVDYLLPRSTNVRRAFVDESKGRPVFWAGSNHGASIVRVEPLD